MTFPACSDRIRVKRSRAPSACAARLALASRADLSPRAAVEPFVVRDIRVEGVQRTEAGTIFSYLPIKVGERVDDEKIAEAVKALYATGFFRDVRLEAQGDVLIVAVQERPTISSIDVRRQQGIRHRHDQEGAEGHRHRGGAHLRPLRARPRRAGAEAPVHHARQVRGERPDDRHAAGAQPRGDQLHDRRRRVGEDRAHQHRRQQGVHREAAALAR